MAQITFLGAAKTVTGSRHLVEWNGNRRIMIDCGMFQGLKELRLKNWAPFPVEPSSIDAIVLTHAHIDHSGYLPRLVKQGFRGPIFASDATCDLVEILLRDSAHIQEEDARYARKYGFSKHKQPEPLYTLQDAENVFPLLQPIPYEKAFPVLEGASVFLRHAGHILGAAFVELTLEENDEKTTKIVFSGDVGRYDQPILVDPDPPTDADYLVLESTYGDRTHKSGDPKGELAKVINRTIKRGGNVVIPAFALGRSQMMLTYIAELLEEQVIPTVDVFLDSPMAVAITWETRSHLEELDPQTRRGVSTARLFKRPEFHYLTTRDQSMKLNERQKPCIIVSASGMATAGRILHHLKRCLPHAKNSVVFVGYQAEGTRGARLTSGEKSIKIHGQMVPVNAEMVTLSEMSGHADYAEMMPWLRKMRAPLKTFIVHGEPQSAEAMAKRLSTELGWSTIIPELGQSFALEPLAEKVAAQPLPRPARRIPFPGAIAVILGQHTLETALAHTPGAVLFQESPTPDLADRIIRSQIFREVYLVLPDPSVKGSPKGAPETNAMIQKLNAAGISVWTLSPSQAVPA